MNMLSIVFLDLLKKEPRKRLRGSFLYRSFGKKTSLKGP